MCCKFSSEKSKGCLNSDCLSHSNQVRCDACLEDNKTCECNSNNNNNIVKSNVEKEANCSFFHAVINMVGMLIGLGQLSTPYALENGGWTSSFLLVGLGIICSYGSHLLGKCLNRNPKSRNYSDIGHQAFGSKGRILTTTFVYMEIFMCLVSYTISLHDNLSTVFSGTHLRVAWTGMSTSQLLTTAAVLVALPSLWLRNLSSISFLSFGGILMSVLIFGTVAWTAVFGGVRADGEIPALRLKKIPAISGLYIFSFAGHIVFPDLYKAMRDPSKFTKLTIVSFTVVTMLYTSLAFTGAKLFGPQVSSQITLSLPRHHIATQIALWATVLTPMTKYALEFAPFAIQLERNILPNSMKSRTKLIVRGTVGSLLLLLILALALSVPYFEHVLSLTGSLVSIGICIVFPCGFYTKIFWDQISTPALILNAALIAVGLLLGTAGTISSSELLIQSMRRAH